MTAQAKHKWRDEVRYQGTSSDIFYSSHDETREVSIGITPGAVRL